MLKIYIWVISHFYIPSGGKWWGYTAAGYFPPTPALSCELCKSKHKHRRYMIGLQEENKGRVLCIRHYIQETAGEVDRILLRLVQPLTVICLTLILVSSSLAYLAFSQGKVMFSSTVTGRQIENIVDWVYRERSRNVARDIIRQQVETVNEESSNLALFVLGCALLDTESVWDPGTIGKIKKNGKWVDGTARGPGCVLASHLDELKKEGIVPKDTDAKILHHPVYGTRAAMYFLKQYLRKAKGNTMQGLKLYLQGEGKKYENVEWNMKLEDYFKRTVNTMGAATLVLDSKDGTKAGGKP